MARSENSVTRTRFTGVVALGAAMLGGPGLATAQQAPVVVPNDSGAIVSGPIQGAEEQVVWELAKRRGTADAYRNYLTSYPNGTYVAEARALLGQLLAGTLPGGTLETPATPTPVTPVPELPQNISPADAARAEVGAAINPPSGTTSTAASAEAGLGLTIDGRRSIQSRLNALGYDTRGIDGTFGSGTRRAITSWQSSRGYPATGYLTSAQADELQIGGRPGGAEGPTTMNAAQTETALNLTSTQMRIIQSRLTQLGYDTRGIDGKFGSGTRAAISAWQRANGVETTGYLTRTSADAILNAGIMPPGGSASSEADAAARVEQALSLGREDRMAVQRGLTQAGHDTRGVDGVFGSGTRSSIRAWQKSRGEPETGYLTAAQLDALRSGSSSTPVVVPNPTPGSTPGVVGAASEGDETALGLDMIARTEVQTRLAALGYDTRGIDGKFGSGTRAAIRSWQGDNALPVTGYLNESQLSQLRRQRQN